MKQSIDKLIALHENLTNKARWYAKKTDAEDESELFLNGRGDDSDEFFTTDANAKFIASAPRMVNMLKKLWKENQKLLSALQMLEWDSQHQNHDCGDEEYCPVLHARKIIKEITASQRR